MMNSQCKGSRSLS